MFLSILSGIGYLFEILKDRKKIHIWTQMRVKDKLKDWDESSRHVNNPYVHFESTKT
jgi:hypothetical protein